MNSYNLKYAYVYAFLHAHAHNTHTNRPCARVHAYIRAPRHTYRVLLNTSVARARARASYVRQIHIPIMCMRYALMYVSVQVYIGTTSVLHQTSNVVCILHALNHSSKKIFPPPNFLRLTFEFPIIPVLQSISL